MNAIAKITDADRLGNLLASQRAALLPEGTPSLAQRRADLAKFRAAIIGHCKAIGCVNARPRPLALYYFGAEDEDRRKVLNRTTSGNVTINGTIMHNAQGDLPFGGVGPSSIGAYHSIEGFRTLSHAKGIYVQGRWNLSNLLRAPFRQPIDTILNIMLR